MLTIHLVQYYSGRHHPGGEDLMDGSVVPENLPAPPDCLSCTTSCWTSQCVQQVTTVRVT
ncbi:hypothetical protein E2C01_061303 [Portunus trituberculatus]|uniref:Uncharacterized protein n=1 Tax=Portunus trituberculatus TaxID=210409 RepID=A0A5B7HCT6_PORTR|nr:hypothetical protein [Portunus trituberculatus]